MTQHTQNISSILEEEKDQHNVHVIQYTQSEYILVGTMVHLPHENLPTSVGKICKIYGGVLLFFDLLYT